MNTTTNISLEESLASLPTKVIDEKKPLIDLLKKKGSPNSKSEEFTYIDTNLLNHYLGQPAQDPVSEPDRINIKSFLFPLQNCHNIVILNGIFSESLSNYDDDVIKILDTANLSGNILPFKQNSLRYLPKGDFFQQFE